MQFPGASGLRTAPGLLVVGAMSMTSCSPAFAQDRETWRCTAPYGHYSDNESPLARTTNIITGRIAFNSADEGEKWDSSARIVFEDSKLFDGDCKCNGLLVSAYRKTNAVGFYMLVDGRPIHVSDRYLGKPITFRIELSDEGLLTVRIGKDTVNTVVQASTHRDHDTLKMSCSGSDVSFFNVAVE